MRYISFVLALLLVLRGLNVHAEDSLPLLKDGKVPQNLVELWSGYDPKKEPLEIEVKKEWESDGVICRIVRYKVGTFKGTPSIMSAFHAFPKGGKIFPAWFKSMVVVNQLRLIVWLPMPGGATLGFQSTGAETN